MRLLEKVAIITGAARGIGREAAILFAKEGAHVVLSDVDETAGREALDLVREHDASALFFKVDVSNRADVQMMVDQTLRKFGQIDILVNNAGITADALLHKMTEEQWDKVVAVNLKGVFNCTQAVVLHMLERGKGVIINTSSVVGIYGNIGQTNYAASKAGVIAMTRTWAKELGRKGIRVNAVAPGFILTDMTAKVPEKVLSMMKERTPLGRFGTPLDVAMAYLYLASDEAAYVNGHVLCVDGGLAI